MGVRNCRDIGTNLKIIIKRLMANDNLCKLLYYEDKDPLSHENLTEEEKHKFLFQKLIKVVPKLDPTETAKSVIAVMCPRAVKLSVNEEFKVLEVTIEIFIPFTQWLIKGENLRPYAILGEIQESLENKKIEGLGKLQGGEFEYNFGSDEMSSFTQHFVITSYE